LSYSDGNLTGTIRPSAPACARPLLIAPSVLAADLTRLGEEVRSAEQAGADVIHVDVMDGAFVPNISFGTPVVAAVRASTGLPVWAHLMIEHPERTIELFREAGSDQIVVHAEACDHLHRVLQQIRATGALSGVALNPHTPLDSLLWVRDLLDSVLIMTVNPGCGGQSFLESMLPKIRATRDLVGPDVDIIVDGGIDERTARAVVAEGANALVAGTSVFRHPDGMAEAVRSLRAAACAAARCG